MDHREKMRKEAQLWHPKAVKLIRAVRYAVAALAILAVAVLFVRNLGFPEEVDRQVYAYVKTEQGEILECSLNLRGSVTVYPLHSGKFSKEDHITVYAGEGGKLLLQMNTYL